VTVPRPSDGRGIKGEGRPSPLLDTRVVYCGDNLEQLQKLANACVDLIYIDPLAWPESLQRGEGPPFNSKRDYNLLFKSSKGQESEAQIEAFEEISTAVVGADSLVLNNFQRCIRRKKRFPLADELVTVLLP
jgi:DNA modification methylase